MEQMGLLLAVVALSVTPGAAFSQAPPQQAAGALRSPLEEVVEVLEAKAALFRAAPGKLASYDTASPEYGDYWRRLEADYAAARQVHELAMTAILQRASQHPGLLRGWKMLRWRIETAWKSVARAHAALANRAPQPSTESYPEFLAKQRRATMEDLLRVLARFTDASDSWGPKHFAGRARSRAFGAWLRVTRQALARADVMPEDEPVRLEQPLTRGAAALLFGRALRIEGGITGHLFGLGKRAAYHELVDERLLPPGGERYRMSGAELLGLMDRARKYEERRERNT